MGKPKWLMQGIRQHEISSVTDTFKSGTKDSGVSFFVLNKLTTHFLEDGKPGGDKVKILQTQPLAIPATVMKKLKSYVCLSLTHGNLKTNKHESGTSRNCECPEKIIPIHTYK